MKMSSLQSVSRELRIARNLAAVVAFSFGMAACTQSEDQPSVTDPAPHTPVNILAGVQNILSRADGINGTGDGFEDGSAIKVVNLNDLTTESTYTLTGSAWTGAPVFYWDDLKAVDNKYKFGAIWPAAADLTFTATQGGTDEILIAMTEEVSATAPVNLTFKHVLSKITVEVKREGDANLTNATISLVDLQPTATFEYVDANGFAKGTLATDKATFTSSPSSEATMEYTAIVPAQEIATIRVAHNGNTYDYTTPVALAQGKITKVTLTLKKKELTLGTIAVTPWETEDKTGEI